MSAFADTLVPDVKIALRITSSDFDREIAGLVDSAARDLELAGVNVAGNADDPLILQAVIFYAKAYFGVPSTAERYRSCYEMQKCALMLSGDFAEESR